jgi:hypothetical protein
LVDSLDGLEQPAVLVGRITSSHGDGPDGMEAL